MKKVTKTNKKPKYAFGGTAMKIDSPSEDLAKMIRMGEDSTYEAMYDPTVLGLKAAGGSLMGLGSSLISKGLGGMEMKGSTGKFLQNNLGTISSLLGGATGVLSFATGGKVPINAEGGEIVESPFGVPIELAGPSHANGGVDLNVAPGTDIYSKRLKGPDGKSMADRKKEREKKESELKKLLKENPTDKTIQKTLKKVQADNMKIDEEDVNNMQYVQQLQQFNEAIGQAQKFASGGTAGMPPNILLNLLQAFNMLPGTESGITNNEPIRTTDIEEIQLTPTPKAIKGKMAGFSWENNPTQTTVPEINPLNIGPIGTTVEETATDKKNLLSTVFGDGGLSFGDTVGLAGNLISTFGPLQNTLKQRKGDTPNVNSFKNYGQEGLKRIDASKDYIDDVRDEKLKDLELSRAATFNRNNNSARGVNTLRALNLASDSMYNNSKSEIYNQFATAMQGILSQEAGMLNDRDAKVMQGEYVRDLADRQDRDAFFSQLSKDISTMGTGIQQTGKNINTAKTRTVTGNILNDMYPNFKTNSMTGQTKAVATEELKNNVDFYKSLGDKGSLVLEKVANREFIRKGNELFDKNGNKIDLQTLEPIVGSTDSVSLDTPFDAASLIDQWLKGTYSYSDKLGKHNK